MTNTAYLLVAVAVCVAITVGMRALPFPVVRTIQRHPIAGDLSRWMPAGAVMILAIYCLAGIKDTTTTHGVAEIAGACTVVLLHLWKRNMLVSIVGGTVICVTLANLL
jgi:branched-subunit amino acid transport protein AzlD